ncbi:hypothetical protein ACFL54_09075 [Planctomycetota bacterium]
MLLLKGCVDIVLNSVIFVVLGVLALLSVLAITFVSMTRLERSISRNYVDRTRAIMAAESGIEAAIAKLTGLTGGVLSPDEMAQMAYNPDDPDAAFGDAVKFSFQSEIPGPGDRKISGAVGNTYIQNGDYYQLRVEDESGKLNLNDNNDPMNPDDPSSARLFHIIKNLVTILFEQPDHVMGSNVAGAILAARDEAGGRFSMLEQMRTALVEDDPFGTGPLLTVEQYRKLERNITLWSWQDPDVIKPIPAWGTYEDAKALYGNPPDDGFPKYGFPFMRWEEVQSFNDGDKANGIHDYGYRLEPRCPVNLNTASKELIQALLAGLEGWSMFEGPGEQYQSKGFVMEGEPSTTYYGYWSSFELTYNWPPTVIGDFIPCHPNFRYENTPRSSSLFREAADKIILDGNDGTDFKPLTLPFARLRNTKIPDLSDNADFSAALAEDLYHRIHGLDNYTGNPDPVENWREFKFYLDNVIARAKAGELPDLAIDDPFAADESEDTWTYDRSGGFQYFNEYYRDLILANFDPNTMSNDYNPDLVLYRHTDNADLITYSTELCFEPTGAFSILAQGSIISGQQTELKASAGVKAVIKLFEFKRLTTQAQLVGDNFSTEEMKKRFGTNYGPYETKWGDIVGNPNGARLVSHPEPVVDSLADKFEFVKNARFDGRLGLSPIKHNSERILDGIDTPAILWSYYAGSMDAHNPGGTVPPGLPSEADSFMKYQIDSTLYHEIMHNSTIAEELREHQNTLMASHSNETVNRKPGTLFVDGVFSEAWKCPAYPLAANGMSHLSYEEIPKGFYPDTILEGGRQTLLMTVKPGFMMKDSNRSRNFFNLGQGGASGRFRNCLLSISRLQHFHQSDRFNVDWLGAPPGDDQHPLAFGCGWCNSCRAVGVHFLRTNFAGTGEDTKRLYSVNGRDAYHFEGRRWNIITASWGLAQSTRKMYISINGQQADYDYRGLLTLDSINGASTLALPFTITNEDSLDFMDLGLTPAEADFKTPIRLGAFARPLILGRNLHEPADSTYGEFVFYKDVILDLGTFERMDDFFWEEGFYYHDPGEPAIYVTPEINLGTKSGRPVTIRSISWTGRWPQYVRADAAKNAEHTDPVWGQLEQDQWPQWLTENFSGDDPGKWAPFLVDIKTDDTWHYEDSEIKMANSGGSIPLDNNGNKLKTDESIKLKFYFNLAGDQVEPLRESPYLDDITITYFTDKPAVLLWRVILN